MARKTISTTVAATTAGKDDPDYDHFLETFQAHFADVMAADRHVFTTDATGLWGTWLAAIPEEHRQHYTCHACRHFIERFGGLVTIDDGGRTHSPIWNENDAIEPNKAAAYALRKAAEKAKVNGVFLSSDKTWGTPTTSEWHHMAVAPPAANVWRAGLLNAHQKMAEHRENHKTLSLALGEFSVAHLEQAKAILQAEAVSRSEKFLGVVEWLLARQEDRKKPHGRNLIWYAVATAPAGFCSPRSSMVGTLLEDLIAGKDFADIQRAFNAKMHPLAYQRPQAAPTTGNIKQAEDAIAKLGLEPALHRRFATVDDVLKWEWRPNPAAPVRVEGVFGHLKAKDSAPASDMALPPQTMTWVKFRDTILPTAERIEFLAPFSGAYCQLVTATDPEAPPILAWDTAEQRNPVSWYFWHGGASASQFGIRGGAWVPVVGLTLKPCMWVHPERHTQRGDGLWLILEGAKETRNDNLALFPEILRGDLHGIRATIEAFSRSRKLDEVEGPQAAGYAVTTETAWNVILRVLSGGQTRSYKLDRWD